MFLTLKERNLTSGLENNWSLVIHNCAAWPKWQTGWSLNLLPWTSKAGHMEVKRAFAGLRSAAILPRKNPACD